MEVARVVVAKRGYLVFVFDRPGARKGDRTSIIWGVDTAAHLFGELYR